VLTALKERLPPERREWLRALRHGNPFRIEVPTEPARIGELVSPLRYDVLLRARHFVFHAEHRDLYARDFDAYARRASEQPYYVWLTRVMLPAWRPEMTRSPELVETAWRERLQASAALYESYTRHGFDETQPIELYAGRSVQPAPTGKRVSHRLFAGDGNHRLSLLMGAGQKELLPSQYRVRRYRALVPADTSGFLLGATAASWSEYRAFIELGYPGVSLEPEGGRVKVVCADPGLRAEVEAVVAIDAPRLVATA
jgi:hypothetical protein